MPSRVEALVRNFLKTDGEALCLVLGERLYLKRGTSRTVVGREPLSDDSFRAIAEELVPGEMVDSLVDARHRLSLQIDTDTEPVEIEFGLSGSIPAMTVCRAITSAQPQPISPSEPGASSRGVIAPQRSGTYAVQPSVATAVAEERPVLSKVSAPGTKAAKSGDTAPTIGTHEPPAPAQPGGSSAPSGSGPASISSDRPIDRILVRMLGSEASDLHLTSDSVPCFRVHGEISPQTDMKTLSSAEVEQLLHPVIPPKRLQEFQDRHDTDFAYEIEGVSRFRVNVFRDRAGVGAVFRQIPIRVPTAAELNLPPAVIQLGDLTKGLVLVTGPTGSGKSTTLAALIDHINETRPDHLITIEDPIEFVHPNKKCLVNQREIGNHTRSFKDALKAALREDPDIVLVGELRDLETIAIAIETSETGHLVFGTVHTTTAPSTVDRIVDQFPEDRQSQIRVMLADSLRAVVAQTLLRKKGGGRVAALEVLISNGAVANLIRDAKTFQLPSVMQTSKAQGMILLNDSLIDLVRRGVVEPREAYLKAVDKQGLLTAYRTMNVPAISEFLSGLGQSPQAAPAAPASGR